jgi:hypothetical protein
MIHWDEVARCLWQLIARAIFVVIVAPFIIIFGACIYALAASQAQHYIGSVTSDYVGAAAAIAFVSLIFYVLGCWFVGVEKHFSCDMIRNEHSDNNIG